jgi:hypothetical protein
MFISQERAKKNMVQSVRSLSYVREIPRQGTPGIAGELEIGGQWPGNFFFSRRSDGIGGWWIVWRFEVC